MRQGTALACPSGDPWNTWWAVQDSYLRPPGHKAGVAPSAKRKIGGGHRSWAHLGLGAGLAPNLRGLSSRTGNAVGCDSTAFPVRPGTATTLAAGRDRGLRHAWRWN
ncbi:MAG TPA: hypothetical protein VIY29_14275 [Ktedonobacteraceae bacterium]